MNLLDDVITYIRRIIKSPSNSSITDSLLIDYINRFWMMDVDARMQLFDLKTKYQFQTTPGVDKYNMPLYDPQFQPGGLQIASFPMYQGFMGPAYINGVEVAFFNQRSDFYRAWPNVVQNLGVVATGDGTVGPYSIQIPILSGTVPSNPPYSGIMRGHIDMAGIIATGQNVDPPITDSAGASTAISRVPVSSVDAAVFFTCLDSSNAPLVVTDSGWLLDTDKNYGLLMQPGKGPKGNEILPGGYSTTSNTINYFSGVASIEYPVVIPSGNNISAQVYYFQSGLPRGLLYHNNVITLRSPPALSYTVELDAYLSPAAFLVTNEAIPFGYMAEYIARGAARKILSDTGDWEQFQNYEPLFREQENLVWKRSQRQNTATRTQTIYSQGNNASGFSNMGNGVNY